MADQKRQVYTAYIVDAVRTYDRLCCFWLLQWVVNQWLTCAVLCCADSLSVGLIDHCSLAGLVVLVARKTVNCQNSTRQIWAL